MKFYQLFPLIQTFLTCSASIVAEAHQLLCKQFDSGTKKHSPAGLSFKSNLMESQKRSTVVCSSFPRRRESSNFKSFHADWIPACAGMTTLCDSIKLDGVAKYSYGHKPAIPAKAGIQSFQQGSPPWAPFFNGVTTFGKCITGCFLPCNVLDSVHTETPDGH